MSCARWITCPPLYSVEAIEASVEASVEASIEVASRLSVEAASRRRGQGSGSHIEFASCCSAARGAKV